MAILSGKKRRGPSSGHIFDRIDDKMSGGDLCLINEKKDLFNSDYIYTYHPNFSSDDEDDGDDSREVGINKNYCKIHDLDYCNDYKYEYFWSAKELEEAPSLEDILEILQDNMGDEADE